MIAQAMGRLVVLAPAALAAFLLCYAAIVLLWPWLARHAVARPNVRSSHFAPVPQGGGIGVVIAALAVTAGAILLARHLARGQMEEFVFVSAAAILLMVVGAMDDMRALPATARLLVQCAAIAAVVLALPEQVRVLPELPWWFDRACLLIGGVWFVNLTNFMDGIDWMTVAEVVPVTGAMVLLGIAGTIDLVAAAAAAALFGAMLGFAPFNKPVARLFLGDSGSLPVGLILAWLLMLLAGEGHRAAALILPLYYLADSTITLCAAWQSVSRSGSRIARITISARPTMGSASLRSWPACSCSTWRWRRSRSLRLRPAACLFPCWRWAVPPR